MEIQQLEMVARLFAWWNERGQTLVRDGATLRTSVRTFREEPKNRELSEDQLVALLEGLSGKPDQEYL